jgi:hypothetical protein
MGRKFGDSNGGKPFLQRSGKSPAFKQMGSSPAKTTHPEYTEVWDDPTTEVVTPQEVKPENEINIGSNANSYGI